MTTDLNSAKGVYVIAVTSFDDKGGLDLEATARMVDFYVDKGVDGLTILGIMGEAGNTDAAQDHFDAYLPYARYEQQLGLGLPARKYVLARRGAIASATLRRPGPKLSSDDIADIERLILRQEKRLKEIFQ